MIEILLWLGLTYAIVDLIAAVALKRCVLPGLKCSLCRTDGNHA